ncbi:YbjN domain-containing protein [Isoptericola sp. b441]|uniref:YbjN domain-containing protein n=1 Tax=Actinotalea lenta TaxID=3064654 RepID=A0ABT9DAU2_9CELL|nr:MULTISPECIES: YbjN domain-containing protein [unclassified Isoptericola]MDO8107394.1 YbjN domain-containing protein [Isoptericola sp. b441]MDO8120943.1 YbjN domain-containing protein [Isoptericola sp. b490]
MGWFTKARREPPPDATATPPLSAERIRAWMDGRGYAWFVDRDGDTGGLWRGRLYYLFALGEDQEILQIRGQWNRSFSIERLTEVLEICNTWNAEKVWPKAYLRVRDDGSVHAICEVATELGAGVTDEQLGQLIECGLASSGAFFDELDLRYPDPAGQAS